MNGKGFFGFINKSNTENTENTVEIDRLIRKYVGWDKEFDKMSAEDKQQLIARYGSNFESYMIKANELKNKLFDAIQKYRDGDNKQLISYLKGEGDGEVLFISGTGHAYRVVIDLLHEIQKSCNFRIDACLCECLCAMAGGIRTYRDRRALMSILAYEAEKEQDRSVGFNLDQGPILDALSMNDNGKAENYLVYNAYNSCAKCNKRYNIVPKGAYVCLCDDCLDVCGANYDADLFKEGFEIYLGETVIDTCELRKNSVVSNSFYYKVNLSKLKSAYIEDVVPEAIDIVRDDISARRKAEADRIKDLIITEYSAEEYASKAIDSFYGGWFHLGYYKGVSYFAHIDDEITLHSAYPLNQDSIWYDNIFRTDFAIEDLEDITRAKMFIKYKGNEYEADLVSEGCQEAIINARKGYENVDIDELGFVSNRIDLYTILTNKTIKKEDIENIRIEEKSIYNELLNKQ